VWIDTTAAGSGWNGGGYDTLSVVSHELGHMLGLDDIHDTSDVMGAYLSPRTRRLPDDQFLRGPFNLDVTGSLPWFSADPSHAFEAKVLGGRTDLQSLELKERDAWRETFIDANEYRTSPGADNHYADIVDLLVAAQSPSWDRLLADHDDDDEIEDLETLDRIMADNLNSWISGQ